MGILWHIARQGLIKTRGRIGPDGDKNWGCHG